MTETGTLIGAVVGTILSSGLVSSLVTYRLNRAKDQTFFMRQKAEALYLAADSWRVMFSQHSLPHLGVAEGKFSYNDMLDLIAKAGAEKGTAGHDTMVMLTRIYFPEIEPLLDAVFTARDRFNDVSKAHKAAYLEGQGVDRVWVEGFRNRALEADKALSLFQAGDYRSGAPTRSARHPSAKDALATQKGEAY